MHEETDYYSYNIKDGSIYLDSTMRGSSGPYYDRSSNTRKQEHEVSLAKIIWRTAYNMQWHW
ncbi:hypothetical protein [Megasphaera elsdenii]|uniref:hypothetical protein n=1 Tax=Megasphaera elsdenii TaxID=907 RepID=UPI002432F798|nr:hypothetical protein [Megasphaera elsdenii]